MIKIVKAGQKEFYATCDMCGCEFTYELSDLKLSCSLNKVACPTCGKDYYHKAQNGGGYGIDYLNWPQGAEPIPCIDQNKDPCAECDWMKTLLKNGTYVGDTPCTWCNKNKFSCNTSGGSILQSGSYPEAHLTDCNCGPNEVCSKCSGGSNEGYTIATSSSCAVESPDTATYKTDISACDGCVATCPTRGDVWKTIQACCSDSCGDMCCENSAHVESEHKCTCKHTNEG
jgi:hypothetical protein